MERREIKARLAILGKTQVDVINKITATYDITLTASEFSQILGAKRWTPKGCEVMTYTEEIIHRWESTTRGTEGTRRKKNG